MIQDIFPQELHIEYASKTPEDESNIFCFHGREVMVKIVEGDICFPTYQEYKDLDASHTVFIYLFCMDETGFFLAMPELDVHKEAGSGPAGRQASEANDQMTGFHFEDIQVFRGAAPRAKCFAGIIAYHLHCWYQNHQFCGRCQHPFERDQKERMLSCGKCGNQLYPKICPAIIAGVTDGDRLLVTRYAQGSYKRYSLVAGFVEIGESAEDAVKREVLEETGLHVKNIQYYKSQPWGFSESLLMGFFAELDGSPRITVDRNELAEAKWIRRDEIQVENDGFSLTNEMICFFKNHEGSSGN